MNSNGNSDDSVTPQPEQVIKNPDNREIAVFLGNLFYEAKYHAGMLHQLYVQARDATNAVDRRWVYNLVDEEERHIKRVAGHLAGARSAFG